MKINRLLSIAIFSMTLNVINGQEIDKYMDDYQFFKGEKPGKVIEYTDVEGSPYLNNKFVVGMIYAKDTSYTKLPLRYNLYTNEIEYQLKGNNYAISNPQAISRINIDKSVFVYLPFIEKGGFYELLVSGNCYLIKRMWVKFYPAETLAVTGYTPAKFIRQNDQFYMIVNSTQISEIKNMKSVLEALQNQKTKMESFIKQEKIKNVKEENLIKIVHYYNSLQK